MPLQRPGLPPVYHEGEKRPPMSINTRRATGDLPTEVTGQVLPPGTSVAPLPKTGPTANVGGPELTQGKQLFPGSTSPPPLEKQPNPNPTPQSPPEGDSSGDKHWRKKQARLERERLAAAAAQGQNAGGDDLTK